ncbi:MAG: Phosphonoacetaldehyde hydrolase [Stenotrophomonas maltophilia]|nr:MAG: Phosphonoacetaldehyde hydrolase [Stenotrophomonas maltophilia]
MPSSVDLPRFTCLLFGLSGDLVDFGALTLPRALQDFAPDTCATRLAEARHLQHEQALAHVLQRSPDADERAQLEALLHEHAGRYSAFTPGVEALLADLPQLADSAAFIDELPGPASQVLAAALLDRLPQGNLLPSRPTPAPDACWQALTSQGVPQLAGSVLISSQPRLLQAGLNAGLWTIGLAACGALCGLGTDDWERLDALQSDRLRAQATLELYRLGVHGVIDHLGELQACLQDIAIRRGKGEKP